jgi:hypothetical protein
VATDGSIQEARHALRPVRIRYPVAPLIAVNVANVRKRIREAEYDIVSAKTMFILTESTIRTSTSAFGPAARLS